MTLPWLPVFIGGIWQALRRHQSNDAFRRVSVFALAWFAVPLVFFSISGSKLPGYILPAVPGAVILSAVLAHSLAARSKLWRTTVVTVAAATLLATLILSLTLVPRFAADDSVKQLLDAAAAR